MTLFGYQIHFWFYNHLSNFPSFPFITYVYGIFITVSLFEKLKDFVDSANTILYFLILFTIKYAHSMNYFCHDHFVIRQKLDTK
jgi:hypothetical protein